MRFNDRRAHEAGTAPAPNGSHDLRSKLDHIATMDPDAGESQPTKAAYAAHKDWAIARYGKSTWKAYSAGGWGSSGYSGESTHNDIP